MGTRDEAGDGQPTVRWPWPISDRGVLTITLATVVAGVATMVGMWLIAGTAPTADRPGLRIEALKYGLGFVAAAGAAVALLIAVRRQRLAEDAHALAMTAQQHTEFDAAERRVTELYVKAVEQLGSDDAAVRLGGLYALERVGQTNLGQRQTVINVWCAYLRMPYWPSDGAPVTPDSAAAAPDASGRPPRQELQVRLTAQRLLVDHLSLPGARKDDTRHPPQAGPQQPFWPGIDLDLSGAVLTDWRMPRGHVHRAVLTSAIFLGLAHFGHATFTADADFTGTTFTGLARFDYCRFWHNANFDRATFNGDARFDAACIGQFAAFEEATFQRVASFAGTTCAEGFVLDCATADPQVDNTYWPAGWYVSDSGRLENRKPAGSGNE
jgi:hypothetical protein